MKQTMQGTISRLAFGGSGITKNKGLVVFVPFSAPEDELTIEIIKQKKTHAFGKILSIDTPSPYRVLARCPYFGECGGCQFQHLAYKKQLEAKHLFVQEALQRIGKVECEVLPIVEAEEIWNYRRHITLHLTPQKEGFQAGFVKTDHASPLFIQKCDIFTDRNLLKPLQDQLRSWNANGIREAHVRIVKTSEDAFLLAFSFFPSLPENYSSYASTLLEAVPGCQGIVFKSPKETHSLGNTECSFILDALSFSYSPYGFVQNHPEQSQRIYQEVLRILDPKSQKILDLYCGIGISSLLLAKAGKEVMGIDSSLECISFAKKNAENNQIAQAQFLAEKAEKNLSNHLKQFQPDAVLINPPRTGAAESVIQILLHYYPKELIYTSCKPATLARDLQVFCEKGYKITYCKPYDMFPQTTHVETLVQLKR